MLRYAMGVLLHVAASVSSLMSRLDLVSSRPHLQDLAVAMHAALLTLLIKCVDVVYREVAGMY